MSRKKLLSKARIGSLELKNRIIFPAIDTSYATKDGRVTETTLRHYDRMASGGAGLITVEAAVIHHSGLIPGGLDLSSDTAIKGFSKIVESIHRHGAKAAGQLFHPGRQTSSRHTGHSLYAPSPKPSRPVYEVPTELTTDEVYQFIDYFVMAALRVKKAGFDALEFHGAHGYLINEFLSPWANQRCDEFGGSVTNRCRFAVEIVQRTRKVVGEDFPILFRISGDEFVEGGYRIEEAKLIAQHLERAGVDALHVSAGNYETFEMMIPPMQVPMGVHQDLAYQIKQVVKLPVITVGRIHNPELAEQILVEKKADFVAIGRAILADPYFVRKVEENRETEIHPCISCNICLDKLYGGEGVQCIQNPELGYKITLDQSPSTRMKKIMVVGAGPAGLQAAIIAAERGHHVSLYERDSNLGGTVRLAATPFFKHGYWNFISNMERRADIAGVHIYKQTPVNEKIIEKEKPDVIILATGTTFRKPNIPGIDQHHVFMAEDVIKNPGITGEKVAIIGGGWTACEVAIVLAEIGKKVAIVKRGGKIGEGIGRTHRWALLKELEERSVQFFTNVNYEHIDEQGLHVVHDGKKQVIEVDSIVCAAGLQSNATLFPFAQDYVQEVYLIGDALRPRTVLDAVHEATKVAISI